MPMTHYVPAFVPAGRHPQAVCGAFIHSDAEFSVEPTCPTCKAWLESDTTTIESFDRPDVGPPVTRQKTWTELLGPFDHDALVMGKVIAIERGNHGRVLWSFDTKADAEAAFEAWREGR